MGHSRRWTSGTTGLMVAISTSSRTNLVRSSPTTLNGTTTLPMSTPWMHYTKMHIRRSKLATKKKFSHQKLWNC
ncbi:hypothetical protein ACSBR2_004007 [Camellia fascicularis]